MKWKLMGAVEKGLFTQVIVMTLLEKHRSLSLVAGHRVDVLKFLPPLTINEADVDQIVTAIDATLEEANVSGSMVEMAKNLGKHALGGR